MSLDSVPASNEILVLSLAPLSCSQPRDAIDSIRSHLSPSPSSPPSSTLTSPPLADSDSLSLFDWTISNKYYQAHVQFRVVQSVEELGGGGGEEPAVIVLAAAERTPPADVAAALKAAASRTPEFDVALLLTLPSPSFSASAPPQTPDEEAWHDLALEHGFEWVDASATRSPGAVEGEEEEEDPIRRIVDALQSHLWDGLVRHDPPTSLFNPLPPSSGDDEEDDDSALPSLLSGGPSLPQAKPYIPLKTEFPSSFLPSIPRGGASSAATGKAKADFEDDFAPFVSSSSSASSAAFTSSTNLPREFTSFSDSEDGDDDERHASLPFSDADDSFDIPAPRSTSTTTSSTNPPSRFSYICAAELDGSDESLPPSEDEDEEDDGLDELFAALSTASGGRDLGKGEGWKGETESETRERRERAERLVRGLMNGEGWSGGGK